MSVIGLTVFWGSQMAIFNPVAGSLGGDEKRISGINHRGGGESGMTIPRFSYYNLNHTHTHSHRIINALPNTW